MKKLYILSGLVLATAVISCSDVQRKPSNIYMPDMAYSRAYETYTEKDSAVFTHDKNDAKSRIYYTSLPVEGTVARGESPNLGLPKDKVGDTTNYVGSKNIKNPIDSMSAKDLVEAERMYLINCGICHGKGLDGNGPLWKNGDGPYKAAPKNLMTLNMPEGQMFYSVTHGKGQMGSYASQLTRKQRWEIIHYIKTKQQKAKADAAPATDATAK